VKRPTMLVEAVLQQAALDLDLSVERDVVVMRRRCKDEGLSFLTITLPQLSDALEQGIETGTFTCPTSFSRHGRLPRFLGGFFKRVFDKDGGLLPEPCPNVIFYIRQICRFMKKLKIGCSPEREARAAKQFMAIEGELRNDTTEILREDLLLDKLSGVLWSQVFPEIDPIDLVCSHGPGVTAERRLANERYGISVWYDRSEFSFPSDLHVYPNYGYAAQAGGIGERDVCVPELDYLSVSEEYPVRVVFVPKTQTSPRVIAIEPSHVQYMQQGLKDFVYRRLGQHYLTRNSIRFERQEPNQRLALQSSIDRRRATLDLKDASDRVHLALVQRIFKTSGILLYLEDSRSLSATLPSGDNIVLSKFASMGSAMCFPVEAMVFYTLIQVAMHRQDGRRPSSRSISEYSREIDIYGDDIIIPVEYTDAVVDVLESYSLRVNVSKSFRRSHFRESCGADFYNGHAVNPVYARRIPSDDPRHWGAEELMAWAATADLFYLRGMWHVASVIHSMLRSVTRGPIPRSREPGAGLFFTSLLFTTGLRYNSDLHGWEQRRTLFSPSKKKDKIDGQPLACLNKWGISVHGAKSAHQPDLYGDRAMAYRLLRQCWADHQGDGGCAGARGPVTPEVGSRFRGSGVQDSPSHESILESNSDSRVRGVDEDHPWPLPGPTEHGVEVSQFCELDTNSPLDYLLGDSNGLDFISSVKRGDFKSYRHWVSLRG
jgi:hypothetical protein